MTTDIGSKSLDAFVEMTDEEIVLEAQQGTGVFAA